MNPSHNILFTLQKRNKKENSKENLRKRKVEKIRSKIYNG
jgi:anti-sigma28 factor (negative regulator of flagellin synthesis)